MNADGRQQNAAPPIPVRAARFVRLLLANCLDIRSIWSIGHDPAGPAKESAKLRLLAFGSKPVLERLRRCDRVHDADVEVLVVVDGDNFGAAWGPAPSPGSLARWAWQEVSLREAYYDEARWADPAVQDGSVVRVRRLALLLWERA